jgi:site-specific recombinase XerD
MRSLVIASPHYNYLLKSYQQYLQVLGYALPTVESWPVHTREFLHWLEAQGNVAQISGLTTGHINDFIGYIKQRKNRRKSGALSSSSINKIIAAVNVFIKFLNSSGNFLAEGTAARAEGDLGERVVLTVPEIKRLYEASFLPHHNNGVAIGQRDRAIIAIFYGCGLRRTEGKNLNITDIDLQKRVLFVRRGKGNKQRYVPIAAKHLQDIKDYLEEGREWFLYGHADNYGHQVKGRPYKKKARADDMAFFVSQRGGRMGEFYGRLAQMKQRAELEKNISLHCLRHSIATHLLQSGMDIEEIAKFLGHGSLASTQIYTHIVNEGLKNGEQ